MSNQTEIIDNYIILESAQNQQTKILSPKIVLRIRDSFRKRSLGVTQETALKMVNEFAKANELALLKKQARRNDDDGNVHTGTTWGFR